MGMLGGLVVQASTLVMWESLAWIPPKLPVDCYSTRLQNTEYRLLITHWWGRNKINISYMAHDAILNSDIKTCLWLMSGIVHYNIVKLMLIRMIYAAPVMFVIVTIMHVVYKRYFNHPAKFPHIKWNIQVAVYVIIKLSKPPRLSVISIYIKTLFQGQCNFELLTHALSLWHITVS